MVAAAGDPAGDAVAGPSDPAELLHVDVDELARPLLLVAVRRLERLQPPELAQPDPGQIPETVESGIPSTSAISAPVIRNRRRRGDHSDTHLVCPQRHRSRRRATIQQTLLALLAVAAPPLRDRAHAHAGGLGRRRERPTPLA